jgi:hypothetical protein
MLGAWIQERSIFRIHILQSGVDSVDILRRILFDGHGKCHEVKVIQFKLIHCRPQRSGIPRKSIHGIAKNMISRCDGIDMRYLVAHFINDVCTVCLFLPISDAEGVFTCKNPLNSRFSVVSL